jgi:PilZ domain-containing protein
MENDRRKSARVPLVAHIEVLDESTDTRLRSRVSDICKEGCYLDMVNPLPSGTHVQLTIASDKAVFRARGRIVYAVPHMGAGVNFEEIEPESMPILQAWIAEAAKKHNV